MSSGLFYTCTCIFPWKRILLDFLFLTCCRNVMFFFFCRGAWSRTNALGRRGERAKSQDVRGYGLCRARGPASSEGENGRKQGEQGGAIYIYICISYLPVVISNISDDWTTVVKVLVSGRNLLHNVQTACSRRFVHCCKNQVEFCIAHGHCLSALPSDCFVASREALVQEAWPKSNTIFSLGGSYEGRCKDNYGNRCHATAVVVEQAWCVFFLSSLEPPSFRFAAQTISWVGAPRPSSFDSKAGGWFSCWMYRQ